MTVPNFKTYKQILDDMIADLTSPERANKGIRITDMNEGSIARTLLEVGAARFDESHYMAEQILKLFFAATTSGEFLMRRVAERGLTPFAGSKSTGNILASRSTPAPFSQLILKGTTYETEDKSVQLETTAETTLLEGTNSVSIPVKAVSAGATGNLQKDTPLKQVGVAVSLIETATVAEPGLTGGADPETEAELREKYLTILRSPGTSGNKADYIKWAMEVSGVGGVYPLPLWNGNGTVKLFLLGMDKNPATQDVVGDVQAYIDPVPAMGEGKAPVGATVTCVAAPSTAINITTIPSLDGTKTLAEVQAAFQNKLTEHLKEIAFSLDTTVRYSYAGSLLLDVPGIIDYSDLRLNNGTANVVIPAGSVAVLGAVVLS
ncbi:MAG TPA: baseplate J/gp47 family protein [Syntrophomonadaceae bacterium]|nr:baseplate J/gp47 family protein [Syntrophomonadaceae bacterium]